MEWGYFSDSILPLLSAQFFVFCLVYFMVAKKYVTREYRYYMAYLLVLTLFLIQRARLSFIPFIHEFSGLMAAVFLLFSIGIPALLLALRNQDSMSILSKKIYFGLGTLSGVAYVVLRAHKQIAHELINYLGFDSPFLQDYSTFAGVDRSHQLQAVVACIVFFTACYHLFHELRNSTHNLPRLCFTSGTLLFAVFMFIAVWTDLWWIYYAGAIPTALFCSGAIFVEIRKQKSQEEKQELKKDDTSSALDVAKEILQVDDVQENSFVRQAKEYIQKNYHRDIGVDELLKTLGISRSHLMRLFKTHCDQSVIQYLTSVRIEQAKQLLRSKSVTETALSVGFKDSNYFSTVFKKNVGMSPRQFQNSSE